MPRTGTAARFLVDADSSVNGVRAVGGFLAGEGHGGLSVGPSSRALGRLVTLPPDRVRAAVYRVMGLLQGMPVRRLRDLTADDLDEWVVRHYGPGPFPAVVVGSVSGAAVHLAAALGAPFLPQTTLGGVRHLADDADDPVAAMHALAPVSSALAARNPRLAVYHMHDPAQDRTMLRMMAYLRLKRLALGPVYERFLLRRLEEGATVVQVENTRTWRVHEVAERTWFQFGGLGGVPEEEYHGSGDRIAEFLARENARARRWDPPSADARRAEGEWGWDPALGEDVAALAARAGYGLRRLTSSEPQQQSAFAAELHRWWYRRLGVPDDRLLVESYVQWDPLSVLRTGSVPFWSRFNTDPSCAELERYLESAPPYRDIHVNVFSHGIESPGVVPAARWEEIARHHALRHGGLVGVDRERHPLDAGATLRFAASFEALPGRHPLPPALTVEEVDRFAREAAPGVADVWRGLSPQA